jgi:hypothetical protein
MDLKSNKKETSTFTLLVFKGCEKILYENGVTPNSYDITDSALSSFDRIELNNAFFVTIVKSTESKVSVEGSGDDIDDLAVTVTNGKLDIRYNKRIKIKQLKRYKIELVVYTPNITEIDAKSASDTKISGFGTINSFTASVSGASTLQLNKTVKSLTAEMIGVSKIRLPWKVENIDAEIPGASSLDKFDANSSEVFSNCLKKAKPK